MRESIGFRRRGTIVDDEIKGMDAAIFLRQLLPSRRQAIVMESTTPYMMEEWSVEFASLYPNLLKDRGQFGHVAHIKQATANRRTLCQSRNQRPSRPAACGFRNGLAHDATDIGIPVLLVDQPPFAIWALAKGL